MRTVTWSQGDTLVNPRPWFLEVGIHPTAIKWLNDHSQWFQWSKLLRTSFTLPRTGWFFAIAWRLQAILFKLWWRAGHTNADHQPCVGLGWQGGCSNSTFWDSLLTTHNPWTSHGRSWCRLKRCITKHSWEKLDRALGCIYVYIYNIYMYIYI